MLVPFVVDPESLVPEPSQSNADALDSHIAFLETWQRIGLLIYEEPTFEGSQLWHKIHKLPQSIRSLWMEFLKHKYALMAPTHRGWSGHVSYIALEQIVGEVSVALVDETIALGELNLPETDLPKVVGGQGGVEVCLLRRAGRSQVFQDAIKRSGTHIPSGQGYETTWAERFYRLATAPIKHVVVVDRYAVCRHLNCRHEPYLSGIERFVRLLDRDATGPRHLTLFSAFAEECREDMLPEIEDSLRYILQRLSRRNVKRLKLVMTKNFIFGQDAHDRFVRFGDHIWDLGIGLETFEGSASPARCSATFKARIWADDYREIERAIECHPKTLARNIVA
jgi:hypothetical protein